MTKKSNPRPEIKLKLLGDITPDKPIKCLVKLSGNPDHMRIMLSVLIKNLQQAVGTDKTNWLWAETFMTFNKDKDLPKPIPVEEVKPEESQL